MSASTQTCTDCKAELKLIALCVAEFLKLSIFSHFSHDPGCTDGKQKTVADFTVQNIKGGQGGTYFCVIQAGDAEGGSLLQGIANTVCFCPHQRIPPPSQT